MDTIISQSQHASRSMFSSNLPESKPLIEDAKDGLIGSYTQAEDRECRVEGKRAALPGMLRTRLLDMFAKRNRIIQDGHGYKPEDLVSWSRLFSAAGSVWSHSSLWHVELLVLGIAALTCSFVVVFVTDPSALDATTFLKLSTFLHVFVGLLIGFWVSTCMQRWYATAEGVLGLCNAVRSLQADLYALGKEPESVDRLLRYGVMSGWLLNLELRGECMPEADKVAGTEELWHDLIGGKGMDHTYGFLLPEECTALQETEHPAKVIWIWVGCIIGRMAQEGNFPPQASPTFCSFMQTCQEARSGIESVSMSVSIQPPYIYVQMLAMLVCLNNVINALAFGMTSGVYVGTKLMGRKMSWHSIEADTHMLEVISRSGQSVVISFLMSLCGPFMYQALFIVGVTVAYPFSSASGSVPVRLLMQSLEKDLHEGKQMAKALPP